GSPAPQLDSGASVHKHDERERNAQKPSRLLRAIARESDLLPDHASRGFPIAVARASRTSRTFLRNSLSLSGFTSSPSKPASRISSRSCFVAEAVTATTGILLVVGSAWR